MCSHRLQWVFVLAMAGCSGFRTASLPDGADLADGASLPDGGVDADASDDATPDSGWTLVYEDPEAADDYAFREVFSIPGSTYFYVGGNHLTLKLFRSRSDPVLTIHEAAGRKTVSGEAACPQTDSDWPIG